MSQPIARLSDSTENAGMLTTPPRQLTVFAGNLPIAVISQSVTSHYPCGQPGGSPHCNAVIVTSSKTVFVNNKGVVKKKDIASCGHKVITGLISVFAS